MPRSLAQVKEAAMYSEPLTGQRLKEYLIKNETPMDIVEVAMEDTDFGLAWRVKFAADDMPENANDTLYFGCHKKRDDVMQAMGDASPADPIGPVKLTKSGTRGWEELVEA